MAKLKAVRGSRDVFIPWDHVTEMTTAGARLTSPALNLRHFAQRPGEIVLRAGLFDRQVVDVEGRRVVRINDLDLARALTGSIGWWRWMSARTRCCGGWWVRGWVIASSSSCATTRAARPPLIDWAQVVPVADNALTRDALRLRVPRERLALMRPRIWRTWWSN